MSFNRSFLLAILLFVITVIIYGFSYQGEGKHFNYFVLLSDAFLHGRLYLLDNPSWLNELITFKGHYYVVYPAMPAILLMPFTALFGVSFPQPYFSIFLGALNVSLCYLFFQKIYAKKFAFLLSLLFGFGTMHWYHAEVGSAWYLAHIVCTFFIWLMLIEVVTKQRLFLIGFLIGCAYLSRLPSILAIGFVLIYLNKKFLTNIKQIRFNYKNLLLLGLGLLPALLFNAIYNYLRFGVVYDISYSLLPVFNEPWYKNGLFSMQNIPIHLKEILFSLPKFSDKYPYLTPSLNVIALWFVTPVLLLIPFANFKNKLVFSAVIGAIILAIPSLSHGSNGFSQFGFRFALDYLPFLLIIVSSAVVKYIKWSWILIILSFLINLWGVLFISRFGIWTM